MNEFPQICLNFPPLGAISVRLTAHPTSPPLSDHFFFPTPAAVRSPPNHDSLETDHCNTDIENSPNLKTIMAETKIKGVVDIVVLLDASGSMQECIDAVKGSISTFINGLASKDANNEAPIKDWRIKICGYRDHQHNEANWFVDNPFVSDVASVQAQLSAANMQATGGGDEPESLLDALYKVAKMDQAGVQDAADPTKWRARSTAARAVIFFTDATFKVPMTIPEAPGGGIPDVITAIMANRIILCGFCPEWQGYSELAVVDRGEFDFVATASDTPALAGLGKPGDEGKAAMLASVNALKVKSSDAGAFTKVMVQLARTITKSATVEAAGC
jgi:hypothetical protein